MQPVLIELGPISLYSFGVFIALAFVGGGYVTYRLAKRAGLDTSGFIDYFLYTAVAGLVGARLWHLLFRPFEVSSVWQVFSLWGGGLAVHGGLLFGFLALWLALRRAQQPVLRWLDVTTVGVAAGLAIGKLGSFLNGDSFGVRTDLPVGVTFNNPLAPANVMGGAIHPVQLYAAVLYGVIAFLLWRRWRKRQASPERRDGGIFWLGLLLLFASQFVLEFLHASIDAMYVGDLRVVTIVTVIGMVTSGVMVWKQSGRTLRRA
jgi:phosphatidylglycerol:prolipoprotein diacylglycerol transferase